MSTTANGTWSYHVWHMRTWKGPVVDTSVLTTSYSECGVTGLLKNWDYFLTVIAALNRCSLNRLQLQASKEKMAKSPSQAATL
ncbi:hypothetical protein ANCCAN_10663 [Ancylostoma caninum]|uniref:Uncharacterized protein n=1 Tax=Ancylostoma caninum TaxID=29170 RepID=A0A368GI20_ANCCA|nr:hypothetical protein ANCCAN_10663 [Ancylostoma caninum]